MKLFFFISLILLTISSCKKDETPVTSVKGPVITTIAPTSGRPDDQIIISGSNFATAAADNDVKINGVKAAVVGNTSTTLTVKVPVSAGSGPVTVTTTAGASAGVAFTYIPDIIVNSVEITNTSASSPSVLKYWKNGVPTNVTDGTNLVYSYAMAVSGNDIYQTGHELTNNIFIAKYWKNGVATALTNGTQNAYTFSITVKGTDVYVAGYEGLVAKYWKNGTPVSLTDGSRAAQANSIVVNGSDVYVGGTQTAANGTRIATVWKNGTATALTNGTTDTQLYAITLVGNDLYAAGTQYNQSMYVPIYWKNSTATFLTTPSSVTAVNGVVNRIASNGTDIYIIGAYGISTVWKNDSPSAFTAASNAASLQDIFFYNNDVYISGAQTNATGTRVATYWKNGVATNVSDGTRNNAAWGIVVR